MSPSPTPSRPAEPAAYPYLPDRMALRRGWHGRFRPLDEAERVALDGIVAAVWRLATLDALEEKIVRAMLAGLPLVGLPSLATLCRYRARLARDRIGAEHDLRAMRRLRPRLGGEARPAAAPAPNAPAAGPRPAARPRPEPARPAAVEEALSGLDRLLRSWHADPERRPDWRLSTSRYALEVGLLAAGRS